MASSPGIARFWRCDLQVHSPLEREFRPGVNSANATEVDAAAATLVQAAIDADLEVVALTDHNSVAFLEPLQKAASDRLVVFPGVEVSAADGYHVLCLFEPGTSADAIQAFLNKIGIERGEERWEDGNVRIAGNGWTFARVVEEVDARGGVSIGPHVRREKGLLDKALANEVRLRNWTCPTLYAVEDDRVDLKGGTFEDDCLLNTRDLYKRDRVLARVWGSDAKSYEQIGAEQTYIKMVEPSIEGLRQAFLDPDSRIRHPDKFDLAARDRIVSVHWDGGFLNGAELTLAQQLTCLIGGKGTGKSTVVESLRFVFEAEPESETGQTQYERLVENALPPGTRVDVGIERRDGSRFTLSRSSPYSTEIRNSDGGVVELRPLDLLDLDIYSQGQILETARQPMAHLSLLNSFLEPTLAPLRQAETDLLEELATNRRQLTEAMTDDERREETEARIKRLEEARKTFDSKGVGKRTELRRALDQEQRLVDAARADITRLRGSLPPLAEFEGLPDLLTEDLPHAETWEQLRADWEEIGVLAARFREAVGMALDNLDRRLAEVTGAESTWAEAVKEKRDEVAKVYRELQDEFPELDLAQFERIDKELDDLRLRVGDAKELAERIKSLLTRRRGLLKAVTEVRRQQYRAREELGARLTDTLERAVRVQVQFQGQREVLAEQLAALKTKVRGDVLRSLAEDASSTPERIGAALLDGPDALEGDFGLTTAQAGGLVERTTLDEKLAIQEFGVPDRVTIEFNLAQPGDTPRYRDLSRLSVGQKATSILLILLAQETRPLVIDQPEDDLDNRFVYQDVVERLRAAKDGRQLVLATHNAHIPVLGDAELIAVLDAEEVGGKPTGMIVDRGSIDSPSIKLAVTQILEGGREAFRRRQEKYGRAGA